jgi:hypothetical protein
MKLQIYGLVTTDATVISYDMVLQLCGIAFALSIPLVLLLGSKPTAPQPLAGE